MDKEAKDESSASVVASGGGGGGVSINSHGSGS